MNIDNINSIDLTNGKNTQPNLFSDFNTYLENKEQTSKLGYNPNAPCCIHFYEWSDLSQEKMFDNATEFIKFLTNCRIYTKYWEDNRIKTLGHSKTGVYVICKPGKTDVIIEDSYFSLKQSFERAKNTPTTTYPTPCVPAVVNQQVGYGGYHAYGCGGYYDGYDEWD